MRDLLSVTENYVYELRYLHQMKLSILVLMKLMILLDGDIFQGMSSEFTLVGTATSASATTVVAVIRFIDITNRTLSC